MDSILPGATQDSIARVGETCVIQYSSGDDSIVLTIHPEGVFATDDFLPGGDITTDAIRLSAVNTEMGEVVVEAETSDPAGIITWDASFLGAFALQM